MISQPTIAALEERGLDYVLGVRERIDSLVRRIVLEDQGRFTPLCVPRATGATQLWVKEVVVEGRRYIVCRNEAEANQDAADRQAVLDGPERQLKRGDKALIGNSTYQRRFLKSTTKKVFAIDPGKVADGERDDSVHRFDGILVLREPPPNQWTPLLSSPPSLPPAPRHRQPSRAPRGLPNPGCWQQDWLPHFADPGAR